MGMRMRWLSLALLIVASAAPAAEAAFPGQNGRLAVSQFKFTTEGQLQPAIVTLNPDGTDIQDILTPPPRRREPAWSPDGTKLAFVNNGDIAVANADGSGEVLITSGADRDGGPAWSPDGTKIAFGRAYWDGSQFFGGDMYTVSPTGGPPALIPGGGGDAAWSPDGTRIAVVKAGPGNNGSDIFTMNPDGSGQVNVTNDGGGHEVQPNWSPDGSRLVYQSIRYAGGVCCTTDGNTRLEVINPDGTGAAVLHDSANRKDTHPAWSPDGTKVAFIFSDDSGPIHILDIASGAVDTLVPESFGATPDWQPIPINSYPRPRGATPTQVALVPAYAQCTAPDRTHGPPLAFPACAAPNQASDELTIGTADSNGKPTKSRGLVRYDAIAGNPGTPADEADVQITVELFDIYEQGTLADYAGQLTARTSLRITDKLNTPHPGGPGAATVTDVPLDASVPCTPTVDPTEGAGCNVTTTADSIVAGAVTETKRSIWELGQIKLRDAAGDQFMKQGLFIP